MADPHWHLRQVGAARAWRMVFGADIDLAAIDWDAVRGFDWGDVRVAHLDHGFTDHPAVKPFLRVGDGVNYMEPGQPPRDPMDYAELPWAKPGHGTRTGSVLCGVDEANGYLGVAPGVPITPYRVTNSSVLGDDEADNVAAAITHAVDVARCTIVSISLGRPFGRKAMFDAIEHAYENGVIVVAAAGQAIHKVVFPGRYAHAVSAGGSNRHKRAWQGYDDDPARHPDIWAPGAAVRRAHVTRRGGGPHYRLGDGTSYATVHISAAAALWLRKHGGDPSKGKARIIRFRRALKASGVSVIGYGQPPGQAKILQLPGLLARHAAPA